MVRQVVASEPIAEPARAPGGGSRLAAGHPGGTPSARSLSATGTVAWRCSPTVPRRLDEKSWRGLRALGVSVREERISRLEGDPGREPGAAGGGLERVVFEDGSTLAREGLFYVPPQSQRSALAEDLGCELERMAHAPVVKNDPATRETTVPGVYAAGDVTGTGPLQSVALAASGAAAAYFVNHALATEDAEAELAALAGGARR